MHCDLPRLETAGVLLSIAEKIGLNMNTIRALAQYASLLSLAVLVAACGGGGGGASVSSGNQGGGGSTPGGTPASYSVAGVINGLTASGLELTLSSGSTNITRTPASSDSSFDFSAQLQSGAAFTISVTQQPVGQICSLDSASGTISTADVSLVLTCSDTPLTVSGSVRGLTQGQLTLNLNNGAESILVNGGDTSFAFNQSVAFGSDFMIAIEIPLAFADQPKAICDLDTDSGVAGTVDVSTLNLVCRGLGVITDLSMVGDQGLLAVDTDVNGSGQAVVAALNVNGGASNYLTIGELGGAWSSSSIAGNTEDLSTIPLGYNASVFIDNSGNDSLVYFDYSDAGGGDWNAQLSEKISGGAVKALVSNNVTQKVSKIASTSAVINGDRINIVAIDNNDTNTPVCVYIQKADGSTAEEFCILATSDMKIGAGEVNSISLAVQVNEDGLIGRGLVVWGQDAIIDSYNVSRVHAARFDLDGNNLVVGVIAGGNTASAEYFFKNPAVVALSNEANDEFALSYQRDSLPPALLSVDSTLTISEIAAVTDGWDARLAPELVALENGDLVWTYLGEDYISFGSILNGSAVTIWRVRFDSNQVHNFSIDVNEARLIVSEAGSLISHQSAGSDPEDNVLIAFRESVRSAAGALGSPYGIGLEKERVRLFVLPLEGDYFSLTSVEGLVTEAVYDDDPNVGGDTRMPLDFSKDDAVLDVSVSSSGEAVLAWSLWKDGVSKNKALQAVRL
ncbi:hypothetical protein, partial [Oleiphilus sp. HI0079]|uniref:hypothetical protein n=4 Tax=unclassified Oleiphilus TaxID=2631174 RepID=UPI000B10CF23